MTARRAESSRRGGASRRATPLNALVAANYASLRDIAAREIRASRLARSISPTSLVAESVVRLMRQRTAPRTGPHLCGLATVLMAQAISDRAKLRRAAKRGGGKKPGPLSADVGVDRRTRRTGERADAASEGGALRARLIEQMEALAHDRPRMVEVVTLHLVMGIPLPRVAALVGTSRRTAYRELEEGRALLAARLGLEAP